VTRALTRLLSWAPTSAAVVVRVAHPTSRLSTGAIVAVVAAAALILACVVWGAARWWAYEPRWTVSLRHSLAEAGWRLSGTWAEFSDWLRLGR
jgi:hypothetical protein